MAQTLDKKISTWSHREVVFWSLMVGLGETYIGAYALSCGFSERYAGLITALPLGLASILQLFSGRLLGFVKSRRRFVIGCAVFQALTLFLITGHALFDRSSPVLLMAVLTFYWLFGLAAGPAWNAWIVALVPKLEHNRFFSNRGKYHELAVLVGLVGAGLTLNSFADGLIVFAVLFVVAGMSRLLSAFSFVQLPEEPSATHVSFATSTDFSGFMSWIRKKSVISMILLVGFFYFGVSIAGPFFTPLMLRQLNMDYNLYMMLIALPFVTRALSYGFFEKIVSRVGMKVVILATMMIITLVPYLWVTFPYVGTIIVFQMVAGVAWAGFEYSILIKQISDFSQEERSRVLTWINLLVGLFSIFGAILGSEVLGKNPSFEDYEQLFTISSVFRFLPLLVVFTIDWRLSGRVLTKVYLRFIGLRVGRGALAKPILYVENNEDSTSNPEDKKI